MKIFTAGVLPTVGEKYRHWENLRHLTPPGDLTHEEWWAGIKLARQSLLRPLPLVDSQGRPFMFAMPDPAWKMVHLIDQKASGAITFPELVANDQSRKRYLVSSLIEESITSSQREGASTTARVAKEMIKSGRSPRNVSERMIVNNYRAMSSLQGWSSDPLTPDRLLELHGILTADPL